MRKRKQDEINLSMDLIIKDDDERLRVLSEPVELPMHDRDQKKIMKQMMNFVRVSQDEEEATKNNIRPSVGIAAPQFGHNLRLIFIRVEDPVGLKEPVEYALGNPEIIETQGKAFIAGGESCLSVETERIGIVERHDLIIVKAYDFISKNIIEIEAKGFISIVLQHEIDHLNGILYYDRINFLNPGKKPEGAREVNTARD